MGRFTVKLTLNNGEKLTYDYSQCETIRTNTFATSDPTRPNFGVYPSTGTLVIKDSDLQLFNRAINGEFDNIYKYTVEIYKGVEKLATHIVNQRPMYNYGNKTLTLNLGNELDELENTNYKGYTYPLESRTIDNIAKDVLNLGEYKNITYQDTDVENLEISIPYLPQTDKKTAMEYIVNASGSSLILSKNGAYTLVDLFGKKDLEMNKSIYKILPKHINQSFVPNIILDNRFTNTIVNATNVYEEIKNELVHNYSKSISNFDNYYDSTEKSKFSGAEFVYDISLKHFKQYESKISNEFLLIFNNNLTKILSINTFVPKDGIFEGDNPKIIFLCKKETYQYKQNYKKQDGTTDWDNIVTDTTNNSYWEKIDEKIVEESNINETNATVDFNEIFGNSNYPILTVENNLKQYYGTNDNPFELSENSFKYDLSLLCGKEYFKDISVIDYSAGIDVPYKNLQLIKYIPLQVTISFNGILKEIKFDKNETYATTDDNTNVNESTFENPLLQQGLGYDNKQPLSVKLANEMQEFYKNGIRTGKLSVIFDRYERADGLVSGFGIDHSFNIGDLVVPCKDNNGTPIITKKENFSTIETVSGQATINSGSNIWYYETTIDVGVFKDCEVLEVNDIYKEPTYFIYNKVKGTITLRLFSNEENGTVSAKIKIIYDKQVSVGVVYKVVGNEVDSSGGEGIQHLVLMESPTVTLPLYYTRYTVEDNALGGQTYIIESNQIKHEHNTANGLTYIIGE